MTVKELMRKYGHYFENLHENALKMYIMTVILKIIVRKYVEVTSNNAQWYYIL